MKKFTLLFVACSMAFLSYAQGDITYELNGGVTNDYGWTSKADMLVEFNADYNEVFEIAESATWYTWETLDVILSASDPVVRIPTFATKMYTLITNEKWMWLHDYIVAIVAEQGLPEIDEDSSADAFWRYNVSAFFVNGKRSAWPISADYATAGQPSAFMSVWKHGFAGPDSYDGTEEVVIPAPYREGFSFDGWYETNDFSGEKVTSIPESASGDITLYANWVEYIPVIKEVWALDAAVETKTEGIVTLVDGVKAYIQDATGGLLVEFISAPDVAAGNSVVVSGTTALIGDYTKLEGASLIKKETASTPSALNVDLSSLNQKPLDYMFELIYIEGLNIESYDSEGAVLSDGVESIPLYVELSQAQFPVGIKVNIKVVVSFDEVVYLAGTTAGVVAAPVPRPDPATYPALEDGKFTLTNRWLVSNIMDNFSSNWVGAADFVRGMAAKDGKMYFVDRNLKQLTVVDGETGEMLEPIKLASNIFTYEADGETKVAGTLPFNDIKIDGVGNVLLGNCITSNAQPFQVWKIDLTTGEGELIVHEILAENYDFAEATIRFDAFGVYGDVDGDAIIMAMNAQAMEAYKWTISNGEAGDAEAILIDTSEEGTLLTGLNNPGPAPQIFPMDEDYFYIDGFATYPTLIDMDGNIIDGLFNDTSEEWPASDSKKQGQNGLIEFSVGDDYFFIMVNSNTDGTPPASFRLFKWADANKEFKDIQSLWVFPESGMGSSSNAYRSAVPSVEVDENEGAATIYLYAGENGYGVYELKVGTPSSAPIVVNNELLNVIVRERTLKFDKQVELVAVYSVTGQLVVQAKQTSSVEVPQSGIYIVRAKTANGALAVRKVVVMN